MNKLSHILLIGSLMFIAACEKREPPAPPPPKAPAEQAAPAPKPGSAKEIVENYASGLTSSVDKSNTGQARTDLGAGQNAVRTFQLENGRYPDSLESIRSYLRPGTDLGAFNYDPATGAVALK